MKGKIISSSKKEFWRDIDGKKVKGAEFTVTKGSRYGTYTATVRTCDEDLKNPISDILGYEFARRKCDIQALHRKAENLKERWIQAETIVSAFEGKSEAAKDKETYLWMMEGLRHQAKIAKRDYYKVLEFYHKMDDGFKSFTDKKNAERAFVLSKKKERDNRSE